MKIRNANAICKCGHTKKEHMYPGDVKWQDSWCVACGLDYIEPFPFCENFVNDNLKYLEKKYEEKQK